MKNYWLQGFESRAFKMVMKLIFKKAKNAISCEGV